MSYPACTLSLSTLICKATTDEVVYTTIGNVTRSIRVTAHRNTTGVTAHHNTIFCGHYH